MKNNSKIIFTVALLGAVFLIVDLYIRKYSGLTDREGIRLLIKYANSWDISVIERKNPQFVSASYINLGIAPEWSSDGMWIAYNINSLFSQSEYIYIVRNDGSQRRKVTNGSQFAWSVKDNKLAFQSDGTIYFFETKCLLKDRTCDPESVFVTHGTNPDWAMEDKLIIFELNRSIYSIDVQTKETIKLISSEDGGCDGLDVSPRNNLILFRCWGELSGFYTINIDGSNLSRMDTHNIGGINPRWAPDEEGFAFIHYDQINSFELAESSIYFATIKNGRIFTVEKVKNTYDTKVMWFSWLPLNKTIIKCNIFCQ